LVHGNIIESHETPWNPMDLMESHRTSWNPTEPHRILRNLMESYGTS
jgi:hypothetical protein